jgi:purine-binding chemotaxis protein CheW
MNERASVRTVAQLRESFDESFSKAAVSEYEGREDLLVIRAASRQLAIRTGEIGGIMHCPVLTPLPSARPALRGLAGVRGVLVAVYSMAALIGESPSSESNGWIVLAAVDRTVAFLFEELVGYERVRSSEVHTADRTRQDSSSTEAVQIAGFNRTVISIGGLLETIHGTKRSGAEEE